MTTRTGCSTRPSSSLRAWRVAPGADGPLFARRETTQYRDEIYLGGFADSCHATRARKSSLVVPGGLPITARMTGDALTVLHTVVADWPPI